MSAFSTDQLGFRHSVFAGKTLSVPECIRSDRYGLVLGPSSVYGFGLAGNENTMPSILGEQFGFPFGNIGLPEGNSRNLFSILLAVIARSPKPPSAIVHISGGDFTNFCYTSIADPVFGSPNIRQIAMVLKERGGRPNADNQIQPLLAFTSLWIRTIAQLCKNMAIPLVLANDTTFFEKAEPSKADKECGLGTGFNDAQKLQFETHRKFAAKYFARRTALASDLSVPLAGPGESNSIGFVDEFHYDEKGTRALCTDFAKALEPIL